MGRLADRLLAVQERIQLAAAGREDVKLIAVSKTKPVEMLLEAFEAGQRIFGENKVQEARDKRALIPDEIDLHLIGPLQKNKAKYCPAIFSTVHTIHRLDVAQGLEKKCERENKRLKILLQMNLTGEETKSGLQNSDELKRLNDQIMELKFLDIIGLMTIPDPALSDTNTRKVFSKLREIKDQEAVRLGLEKQMTELSMGMSSDFELALAEGATFVRVGSAIFGSR